MNSIWLPLLACVILGSSTVHAGGLDDARAALKKGDHAKALEIAGKVQESSKDWPNAQCVIGDVEAAQEHWDKAEKAFRGALAKKPELVPALTGLGRALTARGELDEVGALFNKAVKLDSNDIGAWLGMCAFFIARNGEGDLEGARANLVATLMLDAKHPETNRMMVEVLLKLGRTDEADKAAETYAKADKDSAMSWFLRGLVLEKRAAFEKAIEAHLKAVKKDDTLRDAHKNLALLLSAAKSGDNGGARVEQARAHAQRYVDLGGKDKQTVELLEKLKQSSPPAPK